MSERLPNIVYVMADDMGYGDLGCYGATKIPTPHMDRLATEGIRFRDAHSASAVCSPSRYAVLTGRYCWRSRLTRWVLGGFGAPLIEPDRPTVATMLKGQGYATAAIGKWHVGFDWPTKDGEVLGDDLETYGLNVDYSKKLGGGPTTHGFDYSFNISGSLDMPPYCFIENDRTVGVPTREKEEYFPQQRKGLQADDWRDDQVDVTFAAKAVDFIEGSAGGPFFLYLTPSAPHRPCVPPDFAEGKSQAGPRGDMVYVVDWMVGQVNEALERAGVAEDTLFIVTSDNGARIQNYDGNDYGHKACGDWRGQKADIYEGGHREPFVARWPGHITPGSVSDEPVCLVDMMATFAAITGSELPEDGAEDSYNILPALLGERLDAPIREAVVHHSGNGMFSVRQGKWKLILGLGSGGFTKPAWEEPESDGPMGQLYDMEADPHEGRNVWSDYPDVVAKMSALLEGYRYLQRSR